jgi:hypothetical protein
MPVNYVLIGEITTSVSVASVTFSNIPQTGYTDLKVVWSARGTDNTSYNYITFNGGVGSGRLLYAETSGSTVASFSQSVIQPISSQSYPTVTANTFANCEMYIPNYSVAGVAKSVSVDGVTGSAASSGVLGMQAYITATTSAITTFTIKQGGSTDSGTFLAGSSFAIYGIAAFGTTPTILPKATGGDIITNDGTYWIHTFLSSGVFTPSQSLNCDVLVAAGGGGGGTFGGGGAGGFRTATGFSLPSASYSVTVGAGGSSTTSGSNSILHTITSAGGGGGGDYGAASITNTAGDAGGSGGGGGSWSGGGGTAGAGNTPSTSPSQGNNGGIGDTTGSGAGGAGGGGAGGVGGPFTGAFNSSTATGGTGGVGTANSYSGSSVNYAGGGGGAGYNTAGTASFGGGAGGRGIGPVSPTAGTVNTGGGGGGGYANTGATGGSGIVIVRYTMA